MQQWNQWTETLNCLKNFKVPRALTLSNKIKNIQLHAFCDASTLGFGSVVYLRVTYATDVVTVNLVSSKSHVAPVRPLTVPKLELQGAIVALRLVKFIQSSLRITINQVFYGSDSKTVLQWIASKTWRIQTLVANRVSEILEHSRPIEWRHFPGVENPAAECSRGLFPAEIMENDRSPSWNKKMLIGLNLINYRSPMKMIRKFLQPSGWESSTAPLLKSGSALYWIVTPIMAWPWESPPGCSALSSIPGLNQPKNVADLFLASKLFNKTEINASGQLNWNVIPKRWRRWSRNVLSNPVLRYWNFLRLLIKMVWCELEVELIMGPFRTMLNIRKSSRMNIQSLGSSSWENMIYWLIRLLKDFSALYQLLSDLDFGSSKEE